MIAVSIGRLALGNGRLRGGGGHLRGDIRDVPGPLPNGRHIHGWLLPWNADVWPARVRSAGAGRPEAVGGIFTVRLPDAYGDCACDEGPLR